MTKVTVKPIKDLVKDAIKGTKKLYRDDKAYYRGKLTELGEKVGEMLEGDFK